MKTRDEAPVHGPHWRESWVLSWREPFPPDVAAWLVEQARERLRIAERDATIPRLEDIHLSRLAALAALESR